MTQAREHPVDRAARLIAAAAVAARCLEELELNDMQLDCAFLSAASEWRILAGTGQKFRLAPGK